MLFSPKKNTLVLSALRNTVQTRILKRGLSEKTKKTVKAITKISVLQSEAYYRALDIEYTLKILLAACYVAHLRNGNVLKFSIRGAAYGYADKNILFAVILEIAAGVNGALDIKIEKEKIKITAYDLVLSGYLKKICLKYGIICLKAGKKTGFIIRFKEAKEPANPPISLTDIIENPLSMVNLWI